MSKKTKKQLNTEIKRLERRLKDNAENNAHTSKGKLKQIIKTKTQVLKKQTAIIDSKNEIIAQLLDDNKILARSIVEMRKTHAE